MRGPQIMLGYWKAPDATEAVCATVGIGREILCASTRRAYYVVDRRKEMIKYKGFSIAPAEVESVLLEHPSVRDCGVVSRIDVRGRDSLRIRGSARRRNRNALRP